ncbi:transmembrane protein [Legionella wadsworthii]|uniref:Transmembrane protein n=1 Tax=Legionella wadsworthii TaxID=28088 RepID=A0A378LYY8_9GAMM|nr:hypothetical protein [Legionella wadsworthii]STY29281.1 transmembrane protein [Legionella wadsworthii]
MRDTQRIVIEKTNLFLEFASKLLLLLIIVAIFVPFSPKMPAPGIDPSWALGLNQAVAQGFAFGKDIIFTLGPYSSIYTKSYHPATDHLMILGSVYLAFTYWFYLIFLLKSYRWYGILIYCLPFLGMIYARDSLFFSYPLIAGLISFKILSLKEVKSKNTFLFFVFFLFAPLGLLALIKGSMLIISLLILLLCFIFFLFHNRKTLALICIAAPILTLILFWIVAGQSLYFLPHYLTSSFSIASGFTEAMSSDGNIKEVLFYLFTGSSLLLIVFIAKEPLWSKKIFLLSVYFVFLFVSFKTGFTRHLGHAFISGTSALLAALFLPFIMNAWMSYVLIGISLNSWYFINSHYTHVSLQNNFLSAYSSAWYGLKSRIQDPLWLKNNYTFTMEFLRQKAAFPILKGSTDIYSYDQSYLISSKNIWWPRPIFQSYSVFNRDLAEKNKNHLIEKDSPHNILFKIEPIDQRIASLEDGASWPLLLANYSPTSLKYDFLILVKKERSPQKHLALIKSERHALGEEVNVSGEQLLFTEIDLNLNVFGSLSNFFYKPQQLQIILKLNDGTTKTYRFVANMAKATFMLSPLIENTIEFSLLYKKNNHLNDKRVNSFVIMTKQDKNWHWQNFYRIHFYSFKT